jgi:signal transduction histidine kinase/CheY-like chemotaxis protein/ligand-binding sensor domain-containing protein/HPt (histidine-containing phosphotransfer) domain-containing protein
MSFTYHNSRKSFRLKAWELGFAVFLLLLNNASAQTAPKWLSPSVTSASFSEQLTQSEVTRFYQDSEGYLWMASQSGLNRYDGSTIEHFRKNPREPRGLKSNWITDVCGFNDNEIWLATFGGGVAKVPRTTQRARTLELLYSSDQQRYVTDLLCLEGKSIVIAGTNEGVLVIEKDKELIINELFPGIPKGEVTALSNIPGTNLVLIGTQKGDLHLVDFDERISRRLSSLPVKNMPITAIVSHDGGILVATSDGELVNMKFSGLPTKDPQITWTQNLGPISVFDLTSVGKNFWLASNKGVIILNASGQLIDTLDQFNSGLTNDQVSTLYADRSGLVWLASVQGVMKATPVFYENKQLGGASSNNSVNAFAEAKSGIWIGTDDGVSLYNRKLELKKRITTTSHPDMRSDNIMAVLEDGDLLWLGTRDAGLIEFNLATDKIRNFDDRQDPTLKLSANGITTLKKDSDGLLWVGTFGGGLEIIDTNLKEPEVVTAKLGLNLPTQPIILDIEIDGYGQIWIGTLSSGLIRVNADYAGYQVFDLLNSSIHTQTPWALRNGQDGDLYIGSPDAGIAYVKQDTLLEEEPQFETPEILESFDNKNIYSIEIAGSNLWVTHDSGLTAINLDTKTTYAFDTLHGLTSSEFNHKASLYVSTGDLIFGGNDGITLASEPPSEFDRFKPPISFKKIDINDKRDSNLTKYMLNNTVELGNFQRSFTIEIAVLDFLTPDRNRFRYRLAGFDEEWTINPPGRSALASYSNLPAGEYALEVETLNQEFFNRDVSSASLKLIISPSPWATPLAYALYVALLLFTLWVLFLRSRHAKKQALQRRRELEAMVIERTKELAEARENAVKANNAKSEFLATISHELRTPMHGILGLTEALIRQEPTDEQRVILKRIQNSGDALVKLINQILDFAKIESNKQEIDVSEINLISLAQDITDLFDEVFASKGVKLYLTISEIFNLTFQSDELKIKQCLINLVGNALKFTTEGHVIVTLSVKQDSFFASVKDTGIGIAEEHRAHIFEPFQQAESSTSRTYAGTGLGLTIVSSYVELLGGKLKLDSTLGQGTCVSFSVPNPTEFSTNRSSDLPLEGYQIIVKAPDPLERYVTTTTLQALGATCRITNHEGNFTDFPSLGISDGSGDRSVQLSVAYREKADSEDLTTKILSPKDLTPSALIDSIDEPRLRSAQLNKPSDQVNFEFEQIMIVDDVETNRFLLKMQVEHMAKEILLAENGDIALTLFREKMPKLILMDCQMPIMDGYLATKLIRDFESQMDLEPSYIIALTASALESDHQKCLDCGMNASLTKPFSQEALNKALTGACIQPAESSGTKPQVDDFLKLESETLNQVIKIAGKNFRSLLALYLSDSRDTISKISKKNGLINSEISKLGHKLKSASLSIGFPMIAELAADIERDPENFHRPNLDLITSYLDTIEEKFG